MHNLDRIKRRIRSTIARSSVPEDPEHAQNTLEWLLKLQPDTDEALQIAALGHDIERAMEERKIRREHYPNYEVFKAAHAKNSALILREIIEDCGVSDQSLIDDVCCLVRQHEVGGDPRADLLKDADSISYFDVNLPRYFERNGWEETRRRCLWGYQRLSSRMKEAVATITHENEELNKLLASCIEESWR
jgi:hypothetical protein